MRRTMAVWTMAAALLASSVALAGDIARPTQASPEACPTSCPPCTGPCPGCCGSCE